MAVTSKVLPAPISSELVNVEAAGKDPDQAWADAQRQVQRELTRAGAI